MPLKIAEAVTRKRISLDTPAGRMPMLVAYPAGGRCIGGVVLAQHIGGLSPTMEAEAERVAELGYACVVPALYHRLGDIVIDPTSSDPDIAAIRQICVASVTVENVVADFTAALDWLDTATGVPSGPRGIVGYGGGAAHAVAASVALADKVSAVASILGAGFLAAGDGKPRTNLAAVNAELYFGFAGDDEIIPAEMVRSLDRHLSEARCRYSLKVHPGVRHGYAFGQRPEYAPEASMADWAEIDRMFRRCGVAHPGTGIGGMA